MPNPISLGRYSIQDLGTFTGTGPLGSLFVKNPGPIGNLHTVDQDTSAGGIFQFSLTNVVGVFSGLQINIEFSADGSTNWETVTTWTPLSNGIGYSSCAEAGYFRLNCTSFVGGTSCDVNGQIIPASNSVITGPTTHVIVDSGVITSITDNVSTVPGLPATAATVETNTTTSSSGWTSLVAGSGTETIRLWRMVVSVAAPTNVGIGNGTTIYKGPYYLQAGGSITWDISGEPWFVTAAGAALEVNNSNAVGLAITIWTTQS